MRARTGPSALERELAPACYRPDGPKIGSDAPPRPLHPYGISKALGEIAGRSFVDEGRLRSVVALRIGAYGPDLPAHDEHPLSIGPGDLRTLFRRCVEAEFQGFHVVYGVSAQPTAPYDLVGSGLRPSRVRARLIKAWPHASKEV